MGWDGVPGEKSHVGEKSHAVLASEFPIVFVVETLGEPELYKGLTVYACARCMSVEALYQALGDIHADAFGRE